jgi:hypothetical protein
MLVHLRVRVMTSDSDDLEQQLRENLKLRRQLAAQVDKARAASQRSGIAYRFGWVLYWACILLAVFWMLGLFLYVGEGSVPNALDLLVRRLRQDPLNVTLIWVGATLPAMVLYGLGRAFRYVLAGE